MRKTFQRIQLLSLTICLAASCIASQLLRNAIAKIKIPAASSPVTISQSGAIKLVPTLGYEDLLADLVWLDFVQFLGANNSSQPNFVDSTTNYIDRLLQLDPTFVQVYYFAAIVLGGDCKRPDLAAKFINIGMTKMPTDWSLAYIAGVNQFLYAHDCASAAKLYQRASSLSGAPPWLKGQSQILAANIPMKIKQINVWSHLYAGATNLHFKQIAKTNLCALWLQVYKDSPSEVVKARAANQLLRLGVNVHCSPVSH